MKELGDSERLTRLEGSVESIAASVRSIAGTVGDLGSRYEDISLRLGQVGRWDIKTLLTMGALVAAPIAGMWALAIAPIQQTLIGLVARMERMDERINLNATTNIQQGVMFTEVETQFRQVTEYRNMQHETLEGRVSELWELEFKRPMSRTTQYPVVGNGRHNGK